MQFQFKKSGVNVNYDTSNDVTSTGPISAAILQPNNTVLEPSPLHFKYQLGPRYHSLHDNTSRPIKPKQCLHRPPLGGELHRQAQNPTLANLDLCCSPQKPLNPLLGGGAWQFSIAAESSTGISTMVSEATSQGQRKRTLEALERRFAVAKAELLQQQKKSKGQINEEEGQKEDNNISSINPSSVASLARVADAPKTPPLGTPLKKDITEENDLTYSQLSQPIHENLLTTNVKLQSKRGSMVDKLLHELLQHGDSAQKYLQGHRTKKVESWILLDNYVQGNGKSTGSYDRTLQTHSKRSKKRMSMKQHKKCGSLHLPRDLQKYDAFKPMHEMWKDYILQICKSAGRNQLAPSLLSADLHGAIVLVAGCKVASMVGVSGIMIRETAETFGIITQDDVLRVVPKKLSTFIFQVDCWKITLNGDKLISRNVAL